MCSIFDKYAAYWDAGKGEIILRDSIDISVAVATEKVIRATSFSFSSIMETLVSLSFHEFQGLMTPILRNADQKSISSISSEVC